MSTLRIEDLGAVRRITLARPEKLNALSAELLVELSAAVSEAGTSGARALLITGEGRGFSSGADLSGSSGIPDDLGAELDRTYHPVLEAMAELPIPIVAAVNGHAAGAGCSLALAADIVISARSATFSMGFVKIGLIPDAGATWVLPRLVGRARALEMMLLGDPISADQALDWGLIARVAEDEALAAESLALAERLAAGPTRALGLIRQLARASGHLPLDAALEGEKNAQREAGRSQDFRAGIMGFLTKQPPRFTGR